MSTSERRLFKALPRAPRNRILGYIQEPTFVGWTQIRDIPVSHGQTVFDMVDKLDRDYAGMYPSGILVARTSKLIEQRNEELKAFEL